jgi:hypothetical protein
MATVLEYFLPAVIQAAADGFTAIQWSPADYGNQRLCSL